MRWGSVKSEPAVSRHIFFRLKQFFCSFLAIHPPIHFPLPQRKPSLVYSFAPFRRVSSLLSLARLYNCLRFSSFPSPASRTSSISLSKSISHPRAAASFLWASLCFRVTIIGLARINSPRSLSSRYLNKLDGCLFSDSGIHFRIRRWEFIIMSF